MIKLEKRVKKLTVIVIVLVIIEAIKLFASLAVILGQINRWIVYK